MYAQTPRRLIAFTWVEVVARLVGGVGGWNHDPGVVEGRILGAGDPEGTRGRRVTLVRPAPDRVARKKNETPRIAGLPQEPSSGLEPETPSLSSDEAGSEGKGEKWRARKPRKK